MIGDHSDGQAMKILERMRGGALALAKHGQINALVIDMKRDRGLIPYRLHLMGT